MNADRGVGTAEATAPGVLGMEGHGEVLAAVHAAVVARRANEGEFNGCPGLGVAETPADLNRVAALLRGQADAGEVVEVARLARRATPPGGEPLARPAGRPTVVRGSEGLELLRQTVAPALTVRALGVQGGR